MRSTSLRPVVVCAFLLVAGCHSAPDGAEPEAGAADPGAHAAHDPAQHAAHAAASSPYADETARAIKARSADEVAGLLAGQGLGFAKAAELNAYPGPLHVLELADALDLTPAQRSAAEAARAAMHTEAVRLGRALVDREAALDSLFATGTAEPDAVRTLVAEIGRLEADLRFAHLDAHLALRDALTPEQVARYGRLRGYGG